MHQRIEIKVKNNPLIYISQTKIDSSFKTAVHSHPNLEILLITDGEGYIIWSNSKTKVKKGDLIIINSLNTHFECSDKELSFMAIGLNKIDVFLQRDFTKRIIKFHLSMDKYKNIYALYLLIYQEAMYKKSDYEELIDNSLESLFILIKRLENLMISKTDIDEVSELVNRIKNIIDANYSLNIKLSDIAKSLNTSKSQICHQFKKELNTTIIDYKINRQLDEAANLLIITNMTMIQISTLIGFNNASYFNKVFKKRFKVSPKEYRRLHQQSKR